MTQSFCDEHLQYPNRSHALLHCDNARPVEARREAWDLEDTGGCLGVLLSNPWWELRLLKSLELSGVGRVVEAEPTKRRGAT